MEALAYTIGACAVCAGPGYYLWFMYDTYKLIQED